MAAATQDDAPTIFTVHGCRIFRPARRPVSEQTRQRKGLGKVRTRRYMA